jgi:hypothetical protein
MYSESLNHYTTSISIVMKSKSFRILALPLNPYVTLSKRLNSVHHQFPHQ